jgi:hypothetical protein
MTALSPALLRSSRQGVAGKANLGYIITDEQIKKCRLAQTPAKGEKAEGKKKAPAKGCEIARSVSSSGYDAGE